MDFPEFDYPFQSVLPYPLPLSYAKEAFPSSVPTNSWMQNVISDNTIESGRFFNQLPWYVTVYYPDSSNENIFGLNSQRYTTITQDVTDGDLGEIDEYGPSLQVKRVSSTSKCTLLEYSDVGATFGTQDGFRAYFVRGSPFVVFQSNIGEELNTAFPGTLTVLGSVMSNNLHVSLLESETSYLTNTHFIRRVPDVLIGSFANLKSGLMNTPTSNKFVFTRGSSVHNLTVTIGNMTVTAIINSQTGSVVVQGTGISITALSGSGDGTYNLSLQYSYNNIPHTTVLTVTVDQEMNAYSSTSIPFTQKYTVITPDPVSVSGNVLLCKTSLQLAEGHVPEYQQYAGVYPTTSSLTFETSNSIKYSYSSKGLLYRPRFWLGGTVTPELTELKDSIVSTTYGEMTLTEVPESFIVSTSLTVPPLLPTGKTPGFSEYSSTDLDIMISTLPLVDQYAFGTKAYASCRLLLLAKAEGLALTGKFLTLFQMVEKYMTDWLSGNNLIPSPPATCTQPPNGPPSSEMFLLKRETKWGGIISPADYYLYYYQCYYPLGGFFNSYYSDHHFQWGYFYYILAALHELGSSVLTTERTRIVSLLLDTVNPTSTIDATRTRCKDWYTGHSWATGIQPNLPVTSPDAATSGPIERNEESAGEATNCYYSAYHLATALGLADVQRTSSCCYLTEVLAVQKYNFDNSTGFLERTPTVSLLGNRYRKCNILYGSQPADYWGRMESVNDILFVPFGETTSQLVGTKWHLNVQASHQDPYTLNQTYQVTLDKLKTIIPPTTYAPDLAVNELAAILPPEAQRFQLFNQDMLLMLKLIGMTSVSPSLVQSILSTSFHYQTLNMSQIGTKAMDSYSNTAYWLNKYDKLLRYDTNAMIISQTSEPSTSCELQEIRCRDLLTENNIRVPRLHAVACLENMNVVVKINYRVIDTRPYRKCERTCLRRKGTPCVQKYAKCSELYITEFTVDGSCINMINAEGNTFWEKAQNIQEGVTGDKLLTYVAFRYFTSRLLWGSFKCKYLRQEYHDRYERDMERSDFCNFLHTPEWQSIRHYWIYFY